MKALSYIERARLAELLDLARDPRNYSPIAVPKTLFLKLASHVDHSSFRDSVSFIAGVVIGFAMAVWR